jgi:hypothetical protein
MGGVSNMMVMDGGLSQCPSQEQVSMQVSQSWFPCQTYGTSYTKVNAANGSIRELKRGVGCKMVRAVANKKLWNACLEQESYIRSSTALDIPPLNDHV